MSNRTRVEKPNEPAKPEAILPPEPEGEPVEVKGQDVGETINNMRDEAYEELPGELPPSPVPGAPAHGYVGVDMARPNSETTAREVFTRPSDEDIANIRNAPRGHGGMTMAEEKERARVLSTAPPERNDDELIADVQLRVIQAAPQFQSSPTLIASACKRILREYDEQVDEDILFESVMERLCPPMPVQDVAAPIAGYPAAAQPVAIEEPIPVEQPALFYGRIEKANRVPAQFCNRSTGQPDPALINQAINDNPKVRISGVVKFQAPAHGYYPGVPGLNYPGAAIPNQPRPTRIPGVSESSRMPRDRV